MLIGIGGIAFGMYDIARVRKKRRRNSAEDDKRAEDREAMDSLIEDLKNGDSKVRKRAVIARADEGIS